VVLLVLLAAAPPAPGSSARGSAVNNLRQIIQAMHLYQEGMGRLPTDILDREGRPLLSWRVALLPYLEQDVLFNKFKLDEPWDSPHNRQLIDKVPKVYQAPWRTWWEPREGMTLILQPRGDDTVFLRRPPWIAPSLPGGLGTKILVVESDEDHAVIWTRPADLDYDPANPQAGLARRWMIPLWREKGGMVALADRNIRLIWSQTSPDFLRARFSVTEIEPSTAPGACGTSSCARRPASWQSRSCSSAWLPWPVVSGSCTGCSVSAPVLRASCSGLSSPRCMRRCCASSPGASPSRRHRAGSADSWADRC
jgi:hypothetical protein